MGESGKMGEIGKWGKGSREKGKQITIVS